MNLTIKDKKLIENKYRTLLRICSDYKKEDKKIISKAFKLAYEAHKGIKRKSGEPYILHPLSVSIICAREIGLGKTSIVCSLLHDVVEDSKFTIEDIEVKFGNKTARIIDGLTKISDVKFHESRSIQAENFRKIIITLSDDIRVILIKLADRLDNMRTLEALSKTKQMKISSETLYLYAPLAHRLGLYNIKEELEDLGLKFKSPEIYKAISIKLNETKKSRIKYIKKFTIPIRNELKKLGYKFKIEGRPKSIHSIRNKMFKQRILFDEIYDLFAIRIIIDSDTVNEKSNCWKVYSMVTDFYKPNPDRLRDWISTPKANGYESLHTTVMGIDGKWVEVQIRTKRMNEIAEKGYAAHWKYKNPKNKENNLDSWINKIRELLENPDLNAIDFIDNFKLNLFIDEIFVFSPNGDLINLPKSANCIDFAFEIHTEVGLKCIGSKINGKQVPLITKLKSGDQVEILTSKKQIPRKDWLNHVVTAKAKSKIKNALKEEKKQIGKIGQEILERKLKKIKIKYDNKIVNDLTKYFHLDTSLDLFFKVGIGDIKNTDLKQFLTEKKAGFFGYIRNTFTSTKSKEYAKVEEVKKYNSIYFGDNQEELTYSLAKCCNPVKGDNIFGFLSVTRGGVVVHRSDCKNSTKLQSNFAYRVIDAEWKKSQKNDFKTTLIVEGVDRMGLLRDVSDLISSKFNTNILSVNIESKSDIFYGTFVFLVQNTAHLNKIINSIKKLNGVNKVNRENE